MPTQKEVIKAIEGKACTIHYQHPCLGNISNIIPILTCCLEFKEQLEKELIQEYGEEFVQKTIRLA
jgi:hypothetical protein